MVLGSVREFGEYPLQLLERWLCDRSWEVILQQQCHQETIYASDHRIYIALWHQFSLEQSRLSPLQGGVVVLCADLREQLPALREPCGGKLSAVHRAPPQDKIPGHLHLCLMIIIKDWRGLFSADRWGILFSMQQGIVSLTRISPSMNFLESASDPEGYRWSLWTF